MILGGTVRYEDGIKTTAGDQFSPTRKVAVELNFAIPEDPGIDASSYVNNVLEQAITLTNEKLGIKTATKAAKIVEARSANGNDADRLEAANREQAKLLQTALAEKIAEATKKPRGPGKPKAAAEVVDEIPLDGASTPTTAKNATAEAQATAASDPASMEEWGSEPVTEVTDKDLNDAVQKKNAVLKDPPKIKGLIGAFNTDPKKPFTLREIPQAQRHTFLQRLDALA